MDISVYISRDVSQKLIKLAGIYPIITVTGPRQSGKTTLCRQMFEQMPYLDLERLDILTALSSDPLAFLSQYPRGAILDEAQRYPDLFSYLQVHADEDRFDGNGQRRYILSGSNNFSLLEHVSQSMAGRTALITLLPLSVKEIERHYGRQGSDELMLNGGYPMVWRTSGDLHPDLFANYYATYIERDVRRLVNIKNLVQFQNFVTLCAGRVGTEFNASTLAVDVGVSVTTIKNWLNVLIASYVVHMLPPFHQNIKKRLIKSPKLYFYDTGLVCHLLGINTTKELAAHPLRGGIFENLVVNEFIKKDYNAGVRASYFFYRDKSREIDLLRHSGGNTMDAYEIKSARTYRTEFQSNLSYLKGLLGNQINSTTVVCDTDIENVASTEKFINFRNI